MEPQTALITGASGSIGWSTASQLAAQHFNLILLVRQASSEFSERVNRLGTVHQVKVEIWESDITDFVRLKELFSDFFRGGRQIDVLINNAGTSHGGLVQMTSLETIRNVFEVNFFGQVFITQAVLRPMIKRQRGVIVNVSSIAGLDLQAGNVAYGTSKAALIAFTKTLAAEVGQYGVRVNAVAPGLTDTPMAASMEKKAGSEMVKRSAMGRLAEPSEIARVVSFLSTTNSSFVNGEVIRVDGGQK